MVDVFNSSTGKSNATEVKGRQFVVSRDLRRGLHHRPDGQGPAHRGRGRRPSQAQHADAEAGGGLLGRRQRQAGRRRADHTEIFRYAEMLAEEERHDQAFSLDSTYIHLRPDESALAMEGGAKFWAGIAEPPRPRPRPPDGHARTRRPTGTIGSAIRRATRS